MRGGFVWVCGCVCVCCVFLVFVCVRYVVVRCVYGVCVECGVVSVRVCECV